MNTGTLQPAISFDWLVYELKKKKVLQMMVDLHAKELQDKSYKFIIPIPSHALGTIIIDVFLYYPQTEASSLQEPNVSFSSFCLQFYFLKLA